MISVKYETKSLNKALKNTLGYSRGFLKGVDMERPTFMNFLGGFVEEALKKYIDARARSNPYALHHVYEPGKVGNSGSRLFKFDTIVTQKYIRFQGSFLPSTGQPLSGGDPFVDKANIMENGISITIAPKNSDVLAFEVDGETVFTRNAIVIEHPGGDAVAGSFGEVVDQFFSQYMTNALLKPLIKDLETADEFVSSFGGDANAGVKAGRKYLQVSGLDIE